MATNAQLSDIRAAVQVAMDKANAALSGGTTTQPPPVVTTPDQSAWPAWRRNVKKGTLINLPSTAKLSGIPELNGGEGALAGYGVVEGWNGFANDDTSITFVCCGGHGFPWNGDYRVNLLDDTPLFVTKRPSTQPNGNTREYYPDGTLCARHTYYSIVQVGRKVVFPGCFAAYADAMFGSAYTPRAYKVGDRMYPQSSDGSTNANVARGCSWECTVAGTSPGAPAWPAAITFDVTTITDGVCTWISRQVYQGGPETVVYDLDTLKFTQHGECPNNPVYGNVSGTCLRPDTGEIYISDNQNFAKYNVSTNAYTKLPRPPFVGDANWIDQCWQFHPTMIDPARNRWMCFHTRGGNVPDAGKPHMASCDLDMKGMQTQRIVGDLPRVSDYAVAVHDTDNDVYVVCEAGAMYEVNPTVQADGTLNSVKLSDVPNPPAGWNAKAFHSKKLGGIVMLPTFGGGVQFYATRDNP